MATVSQIIKTVLDSLRSEIGMGEYPPGSNWNPIVSWYNKNVDVVGKGPWCEMAATWAMWTSGAKALKTGRAYTVWAVQDAVNGKNGSSWYWGTKGMRAGDQVYYDWGRSKRNIAMVDHTGIVEKIVGDGTFYVLEGNTSKNKLLRMRRDSTYVVGYVRYDWIRLVDGTTTFDKGTVAKPTIAKPVANKNLVLRIQHWLEVPRDGQWGPRTDTRAIRMRSAARAKLGYPKKVKIGFEIRDVQLVIDTPADGEWGPKSQAALRAWVVGMQTILGIKPDGVWGPATDNAFLAARKRNLNNF